MATGFLSDAFSKMGAFQTYDTLPLEQLFAFSQTGKLEHLSVTEYVAHAFSSLINHDGKVRDDMPYSPLRLRDVLANPVQLEDVSFQSIFVEDVVRFNHRIKVLWAEKGLDPRILPKRLVFRRVEFNQLQRLAYNFQEIDPLQDEALELAWPRMHSHFHNASGRPKEGADSETIRAFWNDSANEEKIEQIAFLDFSGLALKTIPMEIERLTGLQTLSVSDNQLSEIPPYLPNALKELYADRNQITQIKKLPSELRILSLKQNPITEMPDGLCSELVLHLGKDT